MKKDDRYLPVLRVYWDEMAGCYGFRHLAAQPCCIDTTGRPESTDTLYGGLHYPGHYSDEYGWMEGFTVWSQGKNDDQPRNLYGWECHYRGLHSIELRDAERITKTLKRVHQGMHKLDEEWGYCATYPDYIMRVAKVLKITSMIFKNTPERRERSGWQYQVRQVGVDAKHALDTMVHEWVKGNVEADVA